LYYFPLLLKPQKSLGVCNFLLKCLKVCSEKGQILAHSHIGQAPLELILGYAAYVQRVIAFEELGGAHLVLVDVVLDAEENVALVSILFGRMTGIWEERMHRLAAIDCRQL